MFGRKLWLFYDIFQRIFGEKQKRGGICCSTKCHATLGNLRQKPRRKIRLGNSPVGDNPKQLKKIKEYIYQVVTCVGNLNYFEQRQNNPEILGFAANQSKRFGRVEMLIMRRGSTNHNAWLFGSELWLAATQLNWSLGQLAMYSPINVKNIHSFYKFLSLFQWCSTNHVASLFGSELWLASLRLNWSAAQHTAQLSINDDHLCSFDKFSHKLPHL